MAICLKTALVLVETTELDVVIDETEPADLTALRKRLDTDRKALLEHLSHPRSSMFAIFAAESYSDKLDILVWMLRFTWADLQDFVEEANSKIINEERGFKNTEWFYVQMMEDGSVVPRRPRIHFYQTLVDHTRWLEYPAPSTEGEEAYTEYLAAC